MTGLQVAFSLADGAAGGDVSPDTVVTDGRGESAALWVLGGAAGAQSLDAKVVGRDLTVRVTASAGVFGSEPPRGGQRGCADGPGGNRVDRIRSSCGCSTASTTRSRASRSDWSASEGDVSPTSVVTGADGRAATRRILGSAAGTQTATADAPGLAGYTGHLHAYRGPRHRGEPRAHLGERPARRDGPGAAGAAGRPTGGRGGQRYPGTRGQLGSRHRRR